MELFRDMPPALYFLNNSPKKKNKKKKNREIDVKMLWKVKSILFLFVFFSIMIYDRILKIVP